MTPIAIALIFIVPFMAVKQPEPPKDLPLVDLNGETYEKDAESNR